ncbi:MAG: PA14 domain-containing protein [Bacteroidota bacterium]
MKILFKPLLLTLLSCLPLLTSAQRWQMKQAPLMTPFSSNLDTNNVLGEYPRPQLTRTAWMNLNGVWQYQPGVSATDAFPTGKLASKILVPFPVESAVSGVMEHHDRLWYKRKFTLPAGWAGKKILLHFGAVDWETQVFINGQSIGNHNGGYDAFSFDITSFLTAGEQELTVRVFDPTTDGGQPVGKQNLNPGGIVYTPSSGIWQTVWLEPVAPTNIDQLKITPDIDKNQVTVNVKTLGASAGMQVKIIVKEGATQVAQLTGAPNSNLVLTINNPKLWSPDSPFLYDLVVTLTNSTSTVDEVGSYFGMRKISLGTARNAKRMLLNNKFTFQFGPLDQGFWPDGLYTAPSDEALKWDIVKMKEMGFNMVRKHIKVEPARWYYWCDKLGLVVWQDMPNSGGENGNKTAEQKANFEDEMRRMIDTHYNYPSIVLWVVFNEAWAQYETERVTQLAMSYDQTRLFTPGSGWWDAEVGHIKDSHSYPSPSKPESTTRAVVNGEFGGVGYLVEGHIWSPDVFQYQSVSSAQELEDVFTGFCSQIETFIQEGLSAVVYTELTDVEFEINGFITYDRKVVKLPAANLKKIISGTIASADSAYIYRKILPTSEDIKQSWKYSTTAPASNWTTSAFNDASWTTGSGGFGTASVATMPLGTLWNTSDIWLRKSFTLSDITPAQFSKLCIRMIHDDDVEIYLNGVLACSRSSFMGNYAYYPFSQAALNALQLNQTNVIAVHCKQVFGGQSVDVGIYLKAATNDPISNIRGITATYFNGQNFETPILQRTDANINFSWGTGSPAAGINADNFSVRWVGQLQPAFTETYTFHLNSDNGRRLWINDQLIIDKWLNDWGIDYTGTIALQAGQKYNIKVEYFEAVGGASCRLEWESPHQTRQAVPDERFFPLMGEGVTGQYFNGQNFETPILTRKDANISFDWGPGSPDPAVNVDNFSARWTGQIQPAFSETYTFRINSDNGRRLWINNQLIIDKWLPDFGVEYVGTIALQAGQKYDIKLEYFEVEGGATCLLEWESTSRSRQVVPRERLFPSIGDGVMAQYFNGQNFNTPQLIRKDANINFNWGTGSPSPLVNADSFSARWTGLIQPRFTEDYTFYVNSDNGRRLWINNKLIIDKWINDWGVVYSGVIRLNAGQKYNLQLEYFEDYGGAGCQLEWSSISQVREVVPQSQLYSQMAPGLRVSSAEKPSAAQLVLYPNPATHEVTLEWTDLGADAVHITLVNTLGEVAYSQAVQGKKQVQLKTNEWKSGLYIVMVRGNQTVLKSKLIIRR